MNDDTVNDDTVNDDTVNDDDVQAPRVRPLLTVVRGQPTPEQLAALIAVVGSRATATQDDTAVPRELWATPVLRSSVGHGPGAWRASGLPQ